MNTKNYVWVIFNFTNKINLIKIFTNEKAAKKYLRLKMICFSCKGHYYIEKHEIFDENK